MEPFEEQFIKLTENETNPEEILKLISKSEDLYLECKQINSDDIKNGLIGKIDSDAYFHLGKCISAFANAEGGIVVWGLKAKEINKKSPDLIEKEAPIEGVTKVKTDFDSILGKVISRRVVGVQNKVVYKNQDKDIGFIVTYIPKSDEAPHRVEGQHKKARRYYRRHGSCSLEMEHYELEEMFGGRVSPKITFVASVKSEGTNRQGVKGYAIKFGLRNTGRAIAKYPFLEIVTDDGFCISVYGIDGNYGFGLDPVKGSPNKFQGGISHVIHIDDILWVGNLTNENSALEKDVCCIKTKIACDRFRIRTIELNIDLKTIHPEIIESV